MQIKIAALLTVLSAAIVFSSASQLAAQIPVTRPQPEWGFTLGLEAVTGLYQPRINVPFDYATRGGGMALALGSVFKGHLLVGFDVGWAFFGGDKAYPGDVNSAPYATRTTNSIFGSMYTGLITKPIGRRGVGRKAWLGARLGTGRWSGERRVEDCMTCADIREPMRAGVYVSPFIVFGGGDQNSGGGFRFAYTHFVGDNARMRSAMSFGVYFNLLRID